jgi:hypothetical protein
LRGGRASKNSVGGKSPAEKLKIEWKNFPANRHISRGKPRVRGGVFPNFFRSVHNKRPFRNQNGSRKAEGFALVARLAEPGKLTLL